MGDAIMEPLAYAADVYHRRGRLFSAFIAHVVASYVAGIGGLAVVVSAGEGWRAMISDSIGWLAGMALTSPAWVPVIMAINVVAAARGNGPQGAAFWLWPLTYAVVLAGTYALLRKRRRI